MPTKRVLMRHPDTGGVFDCPVKAVDAWTKKGWEVAVPESPALRPPNKAVLGADSGPSVEVEPEATPKPVKAATAAPRKEK